jgi:signal transduction histidine kinase
MTDIRHQVERINELVGEILDFTQGASSELVLPPMDYATFVRQTMDQIRSETVLRSVTIEFENEPPSISLLLNPKRLRRVFYNLIHNAIDAMPRGGKIIWRFSLKPNEIITEVEDTGPGVPPEMAGQLFEAFATHGKAHGTGLGLSICKKIIEDHRGRIALRNEPGHGAIFAFALPRIPEAQSAS